MKNIATTIALALTLVFILSSCSNPLEEIENTPQLAAKSLISTFQTSSAIPGTSTQMYQAEIREYSDGSMDIIRSTVPRHPGSELSKALIQGAETEAGSTSITSHKFPSGGWYVPYDPNAQAIVIGGGGQVVLHCDCDLAGSCNIAGDRTNDGKHSLKCYSRGCQGNCDGVLIIEEGGNRLEVGNGIFVVASTLQVF